MEIVPPVGISFYVQSLSYSIDVYRREPPRSDASSTSRATSRSSPSRGADRPLPDAGRGARRAEAHLGEDLARCVPLPGGLRQEAPARGHLRQGRRRGLRGGDHGDRRRLDRDARTPCRSTDFSGYSDMAIGLGALFGFTFPTTSIPPTSRRHGVLATLARALSSWPRTTSTCRSAGPSREGPDLRQSDAHHAARRPLARRSIDLRPLGCLPRSLAGLRAHARTPPVFRPPRPPDRHHLRDRDGRLGSLPSRGRRPGGEVFSALAGFGAGPEGRLDIKGSLSTEQRRSSLSASYRVPPAQFPGPARSRTGIPQLLASLAFLMAVARMFVVEYSPFLYFQF